MDKVATLGVEEEFHIVDPATGDSVPAARLILSHGDGDVEAELQRTLVETATAVHTDLAALRADLIERRRSAQAAAGRAGLALVAAGTVPASGTRRGRVFPNARYEWMAEEYRQLVDEQQVCSCQVHVGVADRDLAVRLARRIRVHLPALLALTGSSPFFQGEDTGYASYRTVVVSRWPTVGPPPDFESADDYDRTVTELVDSGVISDAGMIYFDARLAVRYPTLEIRVGDACPSVDDALLLASLSRALVTTAAGEDAEGYPPPEGHEVLQRAAMWRAARSGLDGMLIDPASGGAGPAADVIARLLDHVRPVLDDLGEWDLARDGCARVLAGGTSARRQREAVAAGASMADVVSGLIAETTVG